MRLDILIDELKARHVVKGLRATEGNLVITPGNSGKMMHSLILLSPLLIDMICGSTLERSNKKRPHNITSKHSGCSLDPVVEENLTDHPDPTFELSRLSEKDQTADRELLVETGPSQTQQYPVISQPIDKMTDTIQCI
ncbi:hypothetical protein SLE2022_072150 [Rubroshorea leprosula]